MSDSQVRTRVLSSLMVDIKNGKINTNHPLQRQSGQWNKVQMCRLIYCLILDRPMPTFLFSKKHNDNTLFVIDGKQRLTNIYSYINNEYKLNNNFEPVVIDDVEYDVSGKYYYELDDIIKERLQSKELITQIMIDATDQDEREAFADFNSTPSLTKTQLRKVSESSDLMNLLENIKNHNFIKKIVTKKQLLKDFDNELILQVIMLTELDSLENISFSDQAMNKFVKSYIVDNNKIDLLVKSLDVLDEAFKFPINVKKTSLSMVLYGMYYTFLLNKDPNLYISWLKEFLSNYSNNHDYLRFVKDGTSTGKSILGRLEYFKQAIENL